MTRLMSAVAVAMLAEGVTLQSVLARAAEYVAESQRQLAGIVAEEYYSQGATTPAMRPLLDRAVERPRADERADAARP